MGFFGAFTFSGGAWTSGGPPSEPYLVIDVHDSDIASVEYRPAVDAGGRFYLGYQPRIYFEDPTASEPVDIDAEAHGFAHWTGLVTGRAIAPHDLMLLLAPDDEDAEPEDLFVEETVKHLLQLAGLPVPEDLSDET